MNHARSTARRGGTALVVPAALATAVALAPSAVAADSTATFGAASCSGKHTISVSIKNAEPISSTFTVRVDGPDVASPNSIVVPADQSNTTKLTLPDDATTLTVSDPSGKLVGTTKISCSSDSSSGSSDTSGSSDGSSQGSSAGASSSPTASPSSSDSASVAAPAPASSSSGSSDNTRRLIGFGLAGLGVVIAAALLFREFK